MRVPSTDGVELELHDFGGDGPPLLIAHATGMCAGAYLPMVPLLAARFNVWGMDFRAHGDSSVPASGDLAWNHMIDDVRAVADALGNEPLHAIGHSMGGAALVGAELLHPGTLARAFLFEPIVIPSAWGDPSGANPMAAAARRRRPTFESRDAVLARYARRPPLGVWRADALAAYVDHGFADTADGATLKCTPEHEALTFEGRNKPTIETIGPVTTPIVIAKGERDGTYGPAAFAPAIAEALPNGELRSYPTLSHFGPFEDPQLMATEAVAFLAN